MSTPGFYFLRHGETQFNRERRFQGSIDVPLNDTGEAQARQAAHILESHSFSRIVTSPACRARRTSEIVAGNSGISIHQEKDLMEFSVGSLEGRLIEEAKKAHGLGKGDSYMLMLPDDADNWQEFVHRVGTAVKRWTKQYSSETLLITAHGLVFCALAEFLSGESRFSGNAEPHYFKPNNDSEGELWGDAWEIKKI